MQTTALILTCIIGSVSFACLLAGFCALLSPDEADTGRFQEKIHRAQQKGWLHTYLSMYFESLPLSQIVSHWRTRSSVRWLLFVGAACFLLALFTGRFT